MRRESWGGRRTLHRCTCVSGRSLLVRLHRVATSSLSNPYIQSRFIEFNSPGTVIHQDTPSHWHCTRSRRLSMSSQSRTLMPASQRALHCLCIISLNSIATSKVCEPCLLTNVVENGFAILAIDGAARAPKTAGVLDAVAARRGSDRGAARARLLNDSII